MGERLCVAPSEGWRVACGIWEGSGSGLGGGGGGREIGGNEERVGVDVFISVCAH